MSRWGIAVLCAAVSFAVNSANLQAQGYGLELHNILMPVSGGMGGDERRSSYGCAVRSQW